jgi:hypothetical protein
MSSPWSGRLRRYFFRRGGGRRTAGRMAHWTISSKLFIGLISIVSVSRSNCHQSLAYIFLSKSLTKLGVSKWVVRELKNAVESTHIPISRFYQLINLGDTDNI